jgi:hypothetical protein
VRSTTNSGSDVPSAAPKKLTMYSGVPSRAETAAIAWTRPEAPAATTPSQARSFSAWPRGLPGGPPAAAGRSCETTRKRQAAAVAPTQARTRTAPSRRDSAPSRTNSTPSIRQTRVSPEISRISRRLTGGALFATNGSRPRISVPCANTEPIESPTLMFPCPKRQETMELTISGMSVPIATSVMPIRNGGTFRRSLRAVAWRTEKPLAAIIAAAQAAAPSA